MSALLNHLRCDCGSTALMKFDPYTDEGRSIDSPGHAATKENDFGLRWILTCSKCGEQLRIYQTSDVWRAAQKNRKT